ncbi:MAG: flagellar biosynthesis protein FlgJ [Desulfobacteraceae bacterium]|nr:flagellar biosynthesis protein FlgJ [Desulfobacteraceae bacterium]
MDAIDQALSSARVSQVKGNHAANKDKQKLKEACQGFEAIFLSSMLKSMRETLPGDTLFGEGQGLDIYKSMYDQHLADKLAASGRGVGIADFFYKELEDSGE